MTKTWNISQQDPSNDNQAPQIQITVSLAQTLEKAQKPPGIAKDNLILAIASKNKIETFLKKMID